VKWLDKPFDREFFEKYQTQLLYVANNPVGKWYLGISDSREITALNPNSFTVYKGRKKFISTFSGRPKYFKKLKWLAETLRFGFSLPFVINGIPVAALAVTTFNPDANPETTSVDGHVSNTSGGSFTAVRDDSGGVSDPSATTTIAYIDSAGSSPNYDSFWRTITLFDTSSLPGADEINSATYELHIGTKHDGFAEAGSQSMVVATPGSNTNIVNSDYNIANWDMTKQATDLTISGITTGAFNTWTLNSTGLGNISKTGISKFGCVSAFDAGNSEPTHANNVLGGVEAIGNAEGANDPKLVVTHSAAAGGSYAYFM